MINPPCRRPLHDEIGDHRESLGRGTGMFPSTGSWTSRRLGICRSGPWRCEQAPRIDPGERRHNVEPGDETSNPHDSHEKTALHPGHASDAGWADNLMVKIHAHYSLGLELDRVRMDPMWNTAQGQPVVSGLEVASAGASSVGTALDRADVSISTKRACRATNRTLDQAPSNPGKVERSAAAMISQSSARFASPRLAGTLSQS